MAERVKRAILAVSFGTTCDRAEKEAIVAIEEDWRRTFPEHRVRRAYTSEIVRSNLARRGVEVDNVTKALEALCEDGYSHVWVQPTHLIPGEEYDKLVRQTMQWKERFALLKVGEPLLVQEEDYDIIVGIMREKFPVCAGQVCIFMGHGTYHQANRVYEKIEKRLEKETARSHYMATVEGVPSIEDILRMLDERADIRKVTLVPFMLVAGVHALEDMAGEEEESWRSRCRARGYEVECVMHGMGYDPQIRAHYIRKCRKNVSGIFYGISVGPGAGGNLTLDGAACIRSCQVLAVPRTKSEHTIALSIVRRAAAQIREMFGAADYMELSDKEIVYLDLLMTKDEEKRRQVYAALSKRLEVYLRQGKNVGMIVLGDVSVYATVSYLAGPVRRAGYEVMLVPGVNSFCASAAALGRSLTEMSQPLHIIPAGYEGLEESLRLPGSKVLMKSGRNLPEAKRLLKEMGLYDCASMVKDCGMDTEELCWSLDEDTERSSYFTTVLIPGHEYDQSDGKE